MSVRNSLIAMTVMCLASSAFAGPFSYTATDTPLRIPPTGTAGTTLSTIVVPDSGTITDLNVFVNLDHQSTGQLDLFLEHLATGTVVHLFDNFGGTGDHIRDVTFDDQALVGIGTGTPPFGPGSFIPVAALSAFNGESIAGSWRLSIIDAVNSGQGDLFVFRITGTTRDVLVPEPATLALVGVGLLGLGFGAIRRRRATRPTSA